MAEQIEIFNLLLYYHVFDMLSDDEGASEQLFRHAFDSLIIFSPLYKRLNAPKVENFAENVVPTFSNDNFRRHFRINTTAFSILLDQFNANLQRKKGICFRFPRISNCLFDCGISAIWRASERHQIYLMCLQAQRMIAFELIATNASKYIQWPSQERLNCFSQEFQNKSGLPGIVGIVDGTQSTWWRKRLYKS
jgi:hypothetical protein